MKKLKLPIIKGALPASRRLSMEEYLEFVNLNLKYTLNKKAIRKQKKLTAVNVQFSLAS